MTLTPLEAEPQSQHRLALLAALALVALVVASGSFLMLSAHPFRRWGP